MFAKLKANVFAEAKWNRHLIKWAFLLLFTLLVFFIFVFETNLSSSVNEQVKSKMADKVDQIDYQIQDQLAKFRRDIQFLHSTPPLMGLTRAASINGFDNQDDTSYEQWRNQLETIFVAFLETNPEYDQLRVINASNDGKEIVRVDRKGGQIRVVDTLGLQTKSGRDYFTRSVELLDGEMYMSNISLNQEFGRIQFPYRPTLRVSIPIFDGNAERFGFLITNVNAQLALDSLDTLVEDDQQLVMTDSQGYYLMTPNEEHKFSRDLAPKHRWQADYGLQYTLSNGFIKVSILEGANQEFYSVHRKIWLSGDIENGFVMVRLLTPVSAVDALKMERRASTYTFVLVMLSILIVMLLIVYRGMRRSQELAEARALSEAIVSGSKNAIVSTTPDFLISSWNQAAEHLFGYSQAYVLGKAISELSLFDDIDVHALIASLSVQNTRKDVNVIRSSKEGRKAHLSLFMSAIVDDNQSFKGVAIIVRDQTIERQAAQRIKQINQELEEKVAVRTAELRNASEVKNAFISNISHEMRTPLNGIMGTLSIVQQESLSENQKHYLEMTKVSVDSLSVLINDILDLSKIEAGKLDLDIHHFNPLKLIESLCGSLAVKAQEKGLEFVLDSAGLKYQSILSDPHRVSQVVTNLVNNAVKFTAKGYVKVTTWSEIHEDQVRFHCAVEDSGVGIAKKNQSKLFQAFSQENTEIAAKYGGTGLGLSICQQLVALLNGQVTFTSEKGVGSTFSFYINLKQSDCKLASVIERLKDKACLIMSPSDELSLAVNKMMQSLSATCLDKRHFESWLKGGLLKNTSELPAQKPDYIVIDSQSPYLSQWDKNWPQYVSDNICPVVMVMQASGQPKPVLNNIKSIYIGKPVLLSEFLHKVLNVRSKESSEPANHNRQTDVECSFAQKDYQKLAGANILVVDDNEINLAVARGMLSRLPVNIVTASQGQKALEILKESPHSFHCILMDCQMPILNGYTTTGKIRLGEAGEQYISIPIIAMTANAMLGERNKCIEAGMSDYLTKPINIDVLITKLARWVLAFYQAPEPAQTVNAKLQNSLTDQDILPQKQLDTQGWDIEAALTRLIGNTDLFKQICRIFVAQSPKQLKQLQVSIREKNVEKIRMKSHALKGSTGDLGATELSQLLADMEQAAKQQEMSKVTELSEKVEQSYPKLLGQIETYLNNESIQA